MARLVFVIPVVWLLIAALFGRYCNKKVVRRIKKVTATMLKYGWQGAVLLFTPCMAGVDAGKNQSASAEPIPSLQTRH